MSNNYYIHQDERSRRENDGRRRRRPKNDHKLEAVLSSIGGRKSANQVKEWIREVMEDYKLLQYPRGNPVTACRLSACRQKAYVEFRCEEEHRRFLRLREEQWTGRNIRIRNSTGDTDSHRSSIDDTDDNDKAKDDSTTQPKKKRRVSTENELMDGLVPGTPKNRVVRMFSGTIAMIRELNGIMQQEHFVRPDEQAILRYETRGRRGKCDFDMEVEKAELVAKLCLCTGRLSSSGYLFRLAGVTGERQDPVDWFSYYHSRYGHPWKAAHNFIRLKFPNSTTGGGVADEIRKLDKNGLDDFLNGQFNDRLHAKSNGRHDKSRSVVARYYVMRNLGVGYDYLMETTSSEAATFLASLGDVNCGRDLRVQFLSCHDMSRRSATQISPRISFTNKDDMDAEDDPLKPPKKNRKINTEGDPLAIIAELLPNTPKSRVVRMFRGTSDMVTELNLIMQQEHFVRPDEDAILRHVPYQKAIFKNHRNRFLLEAKSTELASRLCLCTGRMSSGGALFRLARHPEDAGQNPVDWFSYYHSRYGHPWKDARNFLRVKFLNINGIPDDMLYFKCGKNDVARILNGRFAAEQHTKGNALQRNNDKGQPRSNEGQNLISQVYFMGNYGVGYHCLVETTSSEAALLLARMGDFSVGRNSRVQIRSCCDRSSDRHTYYIKNDETSCASKSPKSPSWDSAWYDEKEGLIPAIDRSCEKVLAADLTPTESSRLTRPSLQKDRQEQSDMDRMCENTEIQRAVAPSLDDSVGHCERPGIIPDEDSQAKDKEIARLHEAIRARTSELQQSELQTTQIHDDWKELKEQEQDCDDRIAKKELQFVQVSQALSLMTCQQLEDRKQIQELTEKLSEANRKLSQLS